MRLIARSLSAWLGLVVENPKSLRAESRRAWVVRSSVIRVSAPGWRLGSRTASFMPAGGMATVMSCVAARVNS